MTPELAAARRLKPRPCTRSAVSAARDRRHRRRIRRRRSLARDHRSLAGDEPRTTPAGNATSSLLSGGSARRCGRWAKAPEAALARLPDQSNRDRAEGSLRSTRAIGFGSKDLAIRHTTISATCLVCVPASAWRRFAAYQDALAIRQKLDDTYGDDHASQRDLASSWFKVGDVDDGRRQT